MSNINNAKISQICNFIWDLEKKYKLFSASEDGIYFWQLIRFKIYYELTQKSGVFGKPHPAPPLNIKEVLDTSSRVAHSLTTKNPFLIRDKKYKYAVFPHPRQINGVDIYTKALTDRLNSEETIFLYKSWKGNQYPKAFNMGGVSITTLINRFIALRTKRDYFSEKNKALLKEFEQLVFKNFNIKINFLKKTAYEIEWFKRQKASYIKILSKLGIESLYIVVSYTNYAVIAAAKTLNIKVIELQHGTFTKYHLGYSYPVQEASIPYFPDELHCFGRFWPDNTPLPKQTKVEIIGAPYVNKTDDQHQSTPNTIVYSSQGAISQYLFDFSKSTAKLLPDYQIIYRLHPSENTDNFEMKDAPDNFILSSNTPDIFTLLKDTEYQAGVFSTTLLEGMSLGCKTILVNMPGIEYMESVIQNGDAICVDTPEEFAKELTNAPLCKSPEYYYSDINEVEPAEPEKKTKIAIGVITYNRPHDLRNLLNSLNNQSFEQSYKSTSFDVIVIDNDNTGITQKVIEEIQPHLNYKIILDEEKTIGIPFARNKSIEVALRGNYDAFIFVDDDERAPALWLNNHIKAWYETGADIITGPVRGILPYNAPIWAKKSYTFNKGLKTENNQNMRKAFTNNTLVDITVLKKLGPSFDHSFQYTGSSDLHYFTKAYLDGYKIKWKTDVLIEENIPLSRLKISWIIKRGFRVGGGDTHCRVLLNPALQTKIKIVFISMFRFAAGVALIILSPIKGWPAFLSGLRRSCSGIGSFLALFKICYNEYSPDKIKNNY